jgi:hypothetical protein
MSIASEITRLQNAKADLKTAIEGKGVTVPSSAKLDAYPALVESIQAGGGSIEDLITKENLVRIIINIGDTDFTLDASNNFSNNNGVYVDSKAVKYIKFYFDGLEIDTTPIGAPTSPASNQTYNFLVVGSRIFGFKRDSMYYYIYLNNEQIGFAYAQD